MNTRNRWLRSFHFAVAGLIYAYRTQKNMKFHIVMTVTVVIVALFLHLNLTQLILILLAVTLVIVTELMNTAIEKTVDLAMPHNHPMAKIAKDVSAAAVLIAAGFALIVGVLVFAIPVAHLFA